MLTGGKKLLSLGAVRLLAILAPIVFAIALGLTTEFVLEPSLRGAWPAVVATLTVATGAVLFSFFIFRLLRGVYGRIDEQNRELERRAGELQRLTDVERARAEEWKALFELGEEVTASPDVEKLLDSIVARARDLLGGDVSALMLLSADGREVSMAAHSGLRTPGMRTLRLGREDGLQGLALGTGGPVIVEDYQSDERLRNRPATLVKGEGLVSLVAVPFSGKGHVLGTLTVGNRKPTAFSARQAELLQSFAHWTAVVVETSRLYEQLQSLALLEERERIGMDLHDGVIQSIYAVLLRLEDCVERLDEPSNGVGVGLEKAMDDLNKVLQDIRSYIFDLKPEVLQGDLESALKDLVESARVNALIDADLEIEGDLNAALTEEQAISLFHIAQEAVSNVTRHAQAHSLRIKVTARDRTALLEAIDDGVGFDLEEGRAADGHGLRNMDDRARTLGANLSLESSPGQGTRVRVELPLANVRQ